MRSPRGSQYGWRAGPAKTQSEGRDPASVTEVQAVVAFGPEPKPWAQGLGLFVSAFGIGLVVGPRPAVVNDPLIDKKVFPANKNMSF